MYIKCINRDSTHFDGTNQYVHLSHKIDYSMPLYNCQILSLIIHGPNQYIYIYDNLSYFSSTIGCVVNGIIEYIIIYCHFLINSDKFECIHQWYHQ